MRNEREPIWKLRKLKHSDKKRVIDLFKLCFAETKIKEKLLIDYWVWENRQNPDGNLIIVSEHDGRLVGYYGMTYRRLKIDKKCVKVALSIDNMVHPEYRRKGMYVSMDFLINKLVAEEGVPISIGFPNEQARAGHKKAGWIEIFSIPTMVKVIDTKPIIQKVLRNNLLSKLFSLFANKLSGLIFKRRFRFLPNRISIRRITSFDEKFDILWEEASKQLKIIGVRDSTRLTWRFRDIPHRKYAVFTAESQDRLEGYIVIRIVKMKGIHVGLLIDILTIPSDEISFQTLIKAAEKYLQKKKIPLLLSIMINPRYRESLKEAGFVQVTKKFEPREWVFIVHYNDKEINKKIIQNPINWHITFEDTDVF